jgi:hypothetical protein
MGVYFLFAETAARTERQNNHPGKTEYRLSAGGRGMIQILRRRFIITAMLAISVLLVLLGVINTGNIIVNNQRTNQVLNNLIESEGLYTPPEEAMV